MNNLVSQKTTDDYYASKKGPNFIIGGAGKAGTSTLWAWANAHPQIFVTNLKEPRFFTQIIGSQGGGDPTLALGNGRYNHGLDWYLSLFNDANKKNYKAIGEASAIYLAAPDAPRLIADFNPFMRLIFALRHPVDRAYSNYWQERKSGINLPSFEEMYNSGHPFCIRYLNYSRYAIQLKRFLDLFPNEQIHLILFFDIANNSEFVAKKMYRYLGIEPADTGFDLNKKYNPSGLPRFPLLQRILRGHFATSVSQYLPVNLRTFFESAYRMLQRLNTKQYSYPPLAPSLRAKLCSEFNDDVTFVEDHLKRKLDYWRI